MKKALYINTILFFSILGVFILSDYAQALSVKHQYFKAEREYRDLKKSSRKKYRQNWQNCISMFENAHKSDPSDPWAPAAMYNEGFLYFEMAEVSFLKKDIKAGIDIMESLIKKYPASRYKFDAIKTIKENKKDFILKV